ncbi:Arginine--tRNA ligase, cytoplasmic [Trichoplax sp. H2]|nr:Arginine--tRNA ligase, cytoplasmic [Trichoplax sp. H2]|eukprot:RDD45876.1 Arginine--tRNA ligase, cytoplasmic [Trichoplax sp. H2]
MRKRMEDLLKRTSNTEAEIEELKKLIQQLEKDADPSSQGKATDMIVNDLKSQNDRLRYRIYHLNLSIKKEEEALQASKRKAMPNIQKVVQGIFEQAIVKAFPDVSISAIVHSSTQERFGDYQCNNAMILSKVLKENGKSLSPRSVAEQIIQHLPANDVLEKTEIAGPGFINITIKKHFILSLLSDIIIYGVRPPVMNRKMRVLVDFSSPNVAKEMHVGHLRSTIIGDSISRLLEFVGHDVVRISHLGDWGTQFGMLIAHLRDTFPNYLNQSPPIADLQAFYKAAKVRFDEDAVFKKRAYEAVVKLQARESDYFKAWEMICDVSKNEFEKIYQRLGVKVVNRGESFYQDMMIDVVKDLDTRGLLELDEGRKILKVPNIKVPLTIVKSDGGFTYDTSDMAAMRQRVMDEKADWLIYITDGGQGLHFEIIFSASEAVGYVNRKHVRVVHVPFGVVLGEDKKKFKTRSTDTVRLVDLLDEGIRRAKAKLIDKGRDKVLSKEELEVAAKAVAYGCIKYADLSRNRTGDYIFSFDKMLDDKGNTAVYLLYALTRIRSIARLANVSSSELTKVAESASIEFDHPKEWKLAKLILRFPEILEKILDDLLLHPLCDFMYELSCTFTEFYDTCYCIEKDRKTGEILKINMNRLILCEATAIIMEKSFHLLGIDGVDKM